MTVAPLLRRWGLVSAVLLLCAAVLAQNSANADTPPALASATANSGTLTLTFDENLDTASEPATGAFTVKAAPRDVAERTIAVSDVSIAGSAVTLTLASAVAAIDSVTVSYADPGASNDPLRDADGNRVASFTDRDAANLTERARVTAVGRLAQQWEVNINETNLVTHHPFRVIFIFDRAVTGVDEDDYSVLNGELESQNCVSNGRSCWVTVQATGDDGDPIRVTMRTHAVDQGNDEASYESVITAPELTVDISTTATEPVTRTFRASVTFSSEVPQDVDFNYEVRVFPVPSHFSKSDLRIANGSSAGRWTVTERSDDDRAKKFSLLVRPRSNFEGTLTVRLPAGRVVAVVGTRNPEASLDVEVDTLGPRVTGISAVSSTGGDGRYTAGDTVAVEVTFHEDVHLDDSDLPELFLEVGRSTRSAVYDAALSAAAGANKLVFTYRFADVDRDGDGLSVAANSLIGTIKDAHGNEAPLTHAAQGPWSDHRVGAAPVSSDATVTTDEDTDYTFAAGDFSFSDADPGDALASVKITALPANGKGTLALDGTAITWSDVPKAVTKGELDDGKLTYSPPADANGDDYAAFLFKVNDGAEDSASHNEITIDVTPVNDAATGEPAISGVARVGQTLTASTAGIADADGLSGVSYSYQWLRVDADGTSNLAEIANATAATYTLAPDDQGKRVIVTVSFTDEDGTDEALNSDAYPSPGTVTEERTFTLTVAAIATDDKVNIAEQAAGFKISGTTGSEAGVSVTVTIGSASLPATSADDAGTATWSVTVPPNAAYLTEGSVDVTVSAEKVGYTPPDNVERTLAVDLTAPTAPTYAAPAALKVGAAIAAINPAGGSGIDSYAAAGLPPGLIIAADTGAITGTPTTANDSIAAVTVTVSDAAGNADTVDIDFPAVAKGDQTLSGFEYSASTVTFGDAAPTVTAPTGAETELSYTTNDAAVCTVDASTGALTLNGAGSCVVTATAAGTDDWNAATATYTVPVAAAGTPGVPTALLAVAGNGIARLAWTAPAKAGASPVTGYQYQLRADGEGYGAWTDTGHGLGVHQAVTGLSDDTLYTFRVRAVNAAGTGHASAEATATTNTEFRPVIIGDSTAAQATTFRITITFDRDVPELRRKALVVGGGKLVELAEPAPPRVSRRGGREWTAHVEPDYGFTGWLTIDIPAGAVRDTDGNLNVAAVQYRRLIKAQHVRPRLYMKLAPDPETGVVRDPSEPVSGPFAVDLRFTSGSIFHQPVTGLTLDDIVITNGTKANLVQVRAGSFEGDYEVTVTPDPTYTGPFTITVEEGAAYACNDLDDLSTCDESNLSLGDTLALNVAAPNSMRQLNPDLQGKPQKPNGKRFARGRSVTGGTVEGCAVEVTVRFRDADGDAVAVESLAASDFTAENGRVGTPSASPDGLAWTVPAWASRGFTGPMRVRLIATGRWQAAEQVFHVASDTDCAPAARNELASLALDGLDLDPAFDAGTTAYAAAAPADRETVTVTAAAVYGASEVTVLPADADTGAEGHQVALAEGETGVTVTVTPADGSAAQTYTVTVTRGSAAANAGVLTGFVLVDASTDADLGTVESGGTVSVSADGSYGVRAGIEENAEVGSVVLSLVGPGAEDTHTQTENIAPYSLYGDAQGAEHGRALPAGSYTLTATAYAERGGAGEALGTLTVPFAVAVETQAPPALTVADAQAEEGTDATLDFAVTLDKESTGTVTVAYATSDGTATAGSDYTAVSGTLTFAPGETEKTVSVPVLEDDHNEGSETLTLRLSSPSGATIDDGEATGTITNSDAIPEAWLARFGRTVTGQVLDAVEQRLTGPRQAGVRASLAGQALPSWTPGSGLRSGAGGGTAAARSGSGSGTNPGAGSGTRPPRIGVRGRLPRPGGRGRSRSRRQCRSGAPVGRGLPEPRCDGDDPQLDGRCGRGPERCRRPEFRGVRRGWRR